MGEGVSVGEDAAGEAEPSKDGDVDTVGSTDTWWSTGVLDPEQAVVAAAMMISKTMAIIARPGPVGWPVFFFGTGSPPLQSRLLYGAAPSYQ